MTNLISLYIDEAKRVLDSLNTEELEAFCKEIISCYHRGNEIFVCGNGGNAAYAANLVTDLNIHPFVSEDKSIPKAKATSFRATDLSNHGSTITGIVNDLGADNLFSAQINAFGATGDVLIAFSGSGNSANIKKAIEAANALNMKTILITRGNGVCSSIASLVINVLGDSNFPGQTGKNNGNFHFEDTMSKISHMATGLLKMEVGNA